MKKVLFTSILLLSAVSFGGNIYAQETAGGNDTEVTTLSESSAIVEFKASEDGKTLTISGHGDLTSYSTLVDVKVFTSDIENLRDAVWGEIKPGQEYSASAVYYHNNVKIDDNETFFAEHSTWVKDDTKSVSFADVLAQTIADGKFETVKFENTSSTDALKVNNDIISKILFIEGMPSWNAFNSNLINLDLGQATCIDLSSETFSTTDKSGIVKLTTLTLPLTVKKFVMSELTSTKVEKMVLPSEVLGNYYSDITTVTIPEGYDRLDDDAFLDRSKISTFNLPSSLTLIGKAAFKNCAALASIKLNNGLQNIGKEAFTGTQLTSIDFPSSLRMIDDAAFFKCKIFNLKLNAGLQYIGNAAFGLLGNATDNAEKTLEIPASVRYIGPFAFAVHYFQDVFFYGEKAPIMPVGTSPYIQDQGEQAAFSANTYMGNNGFNPGSKWEEGDIFDKADNDGYANRENYKNGEVYFTMLHYPKELNDDQRAAYTDITRVYKTAEGNQKFCYGKNNNPDSYVKVGKESQDLKYGGYDAPKNCDFGFQDTYLGHQYVWPSQEQWRRSYVVNALGYNWDGITPYRSTLSEEDIAILSYAGFKVGKGEYTRDELEKIAHLGTRMFVLADADVNEDKEPEKEPEYPVDVKGGEWWTLCLPFNMTKAMVDETFGEGTQVCLFDRVVRQVNEKTKKNRIVLYFTQNVYKHKTEPKKADGTWNFDETAQAPANDEIVIYAHESYMIHPTKTAEDAVFAVKNYQPAVGSPTPTVVMGKNEYIGASSAPDNVPYRYVGNYLESVDAQTASQSVDAQALQEVKIPKYSYVYASNGIETKFWFLTDEQMTWKPNKCVVQTNTRGDGERDFEEFFDYSASGAKQSSFFGEDFVDTPTSIEDEMVIIAGEGSDAPVYSLDGTLVNTTGDLTGLPKGVYIKGGKKYVVK